MNNEPMANEETSFKDLLEKIKDWYDYLLSQWKLIIFISFIGGIVGFSYAVIQKPIYTATLSFALEDEKSGMGLGSTLGLASSLGLDLGGNGGSVFSGSNLTELFKSRSMVEQTLLRPVKTVNGKTISLAEMYIQNNHWRDAWKDNSKFRSIEFPPNKNRKNFTRVEDSILGIIYENLSKKNLSVVQKDKKISIVTIDMSSTNELFSKYFAESLVNEVSKFYVSTKSKKARINMSILEHQTDSIRAELNNAITGVAVANDNTFNLNPALNVRRVPSARRQVDVQANTAILTELVKQYELAKVTLRRETPLIQIIDSPILPLKKDKLGKVIGFLVGFFLLGFVSILFFVSKKYLKDILIS